MCLVFSLRFVLMLIKYGVGGGEHEPWQRSLVRNKYIMSYIRKNHHTNIGDR